MSSASVRLHIRLLGTPEVSAGAMPLVLNQRKSRLLLFYLAALLWGVTVLVQGEDGIGKSRLIHEFASHLISGSPR